MNEFLFEKLNDYEREKIYPFHMPGHKRKNLTVEKTYSIDITEIDGFDNLQNPEGIIRKLEKAAADLYGTKASFLTVNGSSGSLLAGISATCSYGGKILVGRNCHKAVFNGIALRGLRAVYLYPEICETYDLNGGITPQMVSDALKKEENVEAVLITSPTYDGVVSDIEGIAKEVHKYGIPLIVDEAHGAHLLFSAGLFPQSALECGADIVIHSLHKTLPAFTQTGILHINSELPDKERIKKFLNMYQSTSPSYILMAGIGSCIKWLMENGKEAFVSYEKELVNWRNVYKKICNETFPVTLVGKEIVGKNGVFDYDVSKLIFHSDNEKITGKILADYFLKQYKLQMEMDAKSYCLALSSVFDRTEGFERLEKALEGLHTYFKTSGKEENKKSYFNLEPPESVMTLGEALDKKTVWCPLKDAGGKVSGDYIYLYPPGIPLILPGEVIESGLIENILEIKEYGFDFAGVCDEKIKIL